MKALVPQKTRAKENMRIDPIQMKTINTTESNTTNADSVVIDVEYDCSPLAACVSAVVVPTAP